MAGNHNFHILYETVHRWRSCTLSTYSVVTIGTKSITNYTMHLTGFFLHRLDPSKLAAYPVLKSFPFKVSVSWEQNYSDWGLELVRLSCQILVLLAGK